MAGKIELPGGKSVMLRPKVFPDYYPPKGYLVRDMRCQACWFFYLMAEQGRRTFAKGPANQIIEVADGEPTPLWHDIRYNQQARSVALLYGLDSPDDWQPFWPNVRMQARALGLEPPHDAYVIGLTGRDRII